MLKKVVLIAVVLIPLLAMATQVFAKTDLCDPPPTQGQPRTLPITCYVDKSYTGTTQMGTKDQPFTDVSKAIAEARANDYGGYVFDKQTGASTYYKHVISPGSGAPISRPTLLALLGLVSLILVIAGWFLRRRARILPSGARLSS
jgi:hypothetical protein